MKRLPRNHTFIKRNWKLLRANHQAPITSHQDLHSSGVKRFIRSFTKRRDYKCDCSVEPKGLQIHPSQDYFQVISIRIFFFSFKKIKKSLTTLSSENGCVCATTGHFIRLIKRKHGKVVQKTIQKSQAMGLSTMHEWASIHLCMYTYTRACKNAK